MVEASAAITAVGHNFVTTGLLSHLFPVAKKDAGILDKVKHACTN